ncbi:MAG TPA: carbohydrate ABC transporter permease [Candidatus Limnocylindrales bacterium]|nr:carbohydrate ABC transporter permease [Candidatus Limnocylindrales bacterium]
MAVTVTPLRRPAGRRRLGAARLLALAVLLVVGVVYAFPIYWLLITSLKSKGELFGATPTFFPGTVTFEPFFSIFGPRNFGALLVNSVVVCGAATLLALVLGFAITYPITRLAVSRRLRVNVLNWALSLRFLPPIAVVVPYFGVVRFLGLYDQPLALILVYTLFSLPFAIWMLKGFLSEIPLEVEEAAYVDGASRWQAFRSVLLPLATPGVLAAGIIIFAFAWSEFLFAFILTATPRGQTFPVGVQGLVTQFEIIWNDMAAAGVVAIAVPLALMLAARRYVMAGLTFGVIREK